MDSTHFNSQQSASNYKVVLRRFRSSGVSFAMFADDVEEVAEWRTPTPLPHSPLPVAGIVSVEARMITVLDTAKLLDSGQAPETEASLIVVVASDEQLGLMADSEKEPVEVSYEQIEPANNVEGNLIAGHLDFDGERLNILDPQGLFAAAIRGRERRQRQF